MMWYEKKDSFTIWKFQKNTVPLRRLKGEELLMIVCYSDSIAHLDRATAF